METVLGCEMSGSCLWVVLDAEASSGLFLSRESGRKPFSIWLVPLENSQGILTHTLTLLANGITGRRSTRINWFYTSCIFCLTIYLFNDRVEGVRKVLYKQKCALFTRLAIRQQSLFLMCTHLVVNLGMRQINLTVSCLYKFNTVKQNRPLLTHALEKNHPPSPKLIPTSTFFICKNNRAKGES